MLAFGPSLSPMAALTVAQAFRPAFTAVLEAALAAEVLMASPYRGPTGQFTYFITASCYCKKSLLQSERTANLFIEVLYHYRTEKKYLLHEFVVMPTHFHLLITPLGDATLERAIQLIKGGFSYRAKKELGIQGEVWQTSFYDHRVRDPEEYERLRHYIHGNPVKRGLVGTAQEWPRGSVNRSLEVDEVPQWLKPHTSAALMQA